MLRTVVVTALIALPSMAQAQVTYRCTDTAGKKYTVTAGLFVRNVLNTWNPGAPEGNLLSPRFGETLSLAGAGGPLGGGPLGGATQSANRRIELTLRFSF